MTVVLPTLVCVGHECRREVCRTPPIRSEAPIRLVIAPLHLCHVCGEALSTGYGAWQHAWGEVGPSSIQGGVEACRARTKDNP